MRAHFESLSIDPISGSGTIGRMMNTVVDRYMFKFVQIYALQAADVLAVLLRVGPPLVMRIDAANRAKQMSRGFGVEPILAKKLLTFRDSET